MDFENFFDEHIELIAKVLEAIESGDASFLLKALHDDARLLRLPISGIPGNPTLLHVAARHGRTEMCAELHERGLDLDEEASNRGFHVPLAEAAYQGHLSTVRWFADAGAQVDGTARSVCTPLMSAAMRGHARVVDTLLEVGAEVNRVHGKWNKTATDFATDYDHAETRDILMRHGGVTITGPRTDWSQVFGGSILAYVEDAVGQVLPIALQPVAGDLDIRLRIARIDDKDAYRLLFTHGLFTQTPSVELAFVVPKSWPLHQSMVGDASSHRFPIASLLSLSDALRGGDSIEQGQVFVPDASPLKGVPWPPGIAGLIAVDHVWSPPEDADARGESDASDEVTILVLMPISVTKQGLPRGAKKDRLLARLRTASWKKASLPAG